MSMKVSREKGAEICTRLDDRRSNQQEDEGESVHKPSSAVRSMPPHPPLSLPTILTAKTIPGRGHGMSCRGQEVGVLLEAQGPAPVFPSRRFP